ncbi:mpv17-like protein [Neocloeon triangulifer]|uniref:mpv17-like protein n=1 Tax=Neocloeon triangulifer TaxID=2078957 RepID=UPI00286F69A4|nr:mpv17-like protein [Neocloeon triangulifer]
MALALIKRVFKKYPLVANCGVYGTLYVGAELSQQTINKKFLAPIPEPYDQGTLARYGVVGTFIYPTILFNWYKWLDARFVGTAAPIIVKKLLLDQFLLTPPLLVIFYASMSIMERKGDILEECRNKIIPTFKTSCMFWLPAQSINFMLVPPAARVVYVGSCAFIWVNILCWFKRQNY